MKSILITSLFVFAAALPASAQEYQGCFMIDASRRLIRLPELCPQVQPMPTAATTGSTPTFQPLPADIGDRVAVFFAARYCDQRETGVVSREDARSSAWEKTFAMMESLYGLDQSKAFFDLPQEPLLDDIDRLISLGCPGR